MKPALFSFPRFLRSSPALLAVLPFVAAADFTLDFDTDLQGVTAGSTAGTSLVWSSEFGGSMAYTVPSGYVQNAAVLNLMGDPALKEEYENAIAAGGSLTFIAHVKQSDITGTGQPGWFEGFVIANSSSTYDQEYGAANGVFNVGGFPLSEDFTTTVIMPILGVASGGNTSRNSKLEFNTESGYAQLLFGLNSGSGDGLFTGATIYISKITIAGTPPPPPPVAAGYTFETTKEAFGVWPFGGGGGTVEWSPDFGGSLKLGTHNSYWNFQKLITSGPQVANLKAAVERGGTLSFDVIGPVGTLANKGFSVSLQSFSGYFFSQVDPQLDPSTVVTLPDGLNEIGRVTVTTASFPKLVSGSGYNFAVGYNPVTPTAVPLYIDNVLFSPYSANSAMLTFDTDEQNLVALTDTTIYQDSRGVSIENPAGYQGGASATFSAGDTDPQVAAVYQKLVEASTKGGVLRYKVKNLLVLDQAETYGGLNIDTAYNGAAYQQVYTWIPNSDLTQGGDAGSDPVLPNNETAADYSRTVEVRIFPEGSTAAGGFVLPANASSYVFEIKSGYPETDASSVSFVIDDLEVIVNGDPEIVYTPPLPAGSAGFVGRVLSNAQSTGTFSATGLPPGITIDPATGLIHGTPTTNGTYNVVFSVTRGGVTDMTDSLVWEITGAAAAMNLKITSFTITGTTAVLNWSGAGAKPVNVERSTSLGAGSWQVVSPGNTTGTFTDTTAPPGKSFYRLAVP